jgi:acylphosphatase
VTHAVDRSVDLHVTGRVQGVSFRWYAAREATRLGLAGWVRNEPDGSVRAHAEGAHDAVDDFVVWCRHGPPAARVDDLAVTEVQQSGATSFGITD